MKMLSKRNLKGLKKRFTDTVMPNKTKERRKKKKKKKNEKEKKNFFY